MSTYQYVDIDHEHVGYRDTAGVNYALNDPTVLAWIAAGNTPDPATPPPLRYTDMGQFEARARTTNATPTELYRLPLSTETGYDTVSRLIAVDAANGAMKKLVVDASYERLLNGALVIGQTVTVTHATGGTPGTNAGVANWTVTGAANGNDIVVTVTGVAGRTIDWRVKGTVETFTPKGAS